MQHISFLSFRLSSYVDDKITVGQFYSDNNGKVSLIISDDKLKVLKSIIPHTLYLHFTRFIRTCKKHNLNYSDLIYQSRYQNGIINISYPSPFAGDLENSEEAFNTHIKDSYKKHYENNINK